MSAPPPPATPPNRAVRARAPLGNKPAHKQDLPAGFIALATIVGAHGVRGAVKLRVAAGTDLAEMPALTLPDGTAVRLLQQQGESAQAQLAGLTNREAAAALRGTPVGVWRNVLPPAATHEFYVADLVGLRAQDAAGQAIGVVQAVHDYGAGVMLEISPITAPNKVGAKSASFMVPFRDAFVPQVQLAAGWLQLAVPADWLEPARQSEEQA